MSKESLSGDYSRAVRSCQARSGCPRFIGAIQWALATSSVSGPVNAVAPGAITMETLCAGLGRVLHRPSWLPVPGFALKVALGELGTLMTTGQRVGPAKALAGGYTFQYSSLEPALRAILTNE